MQNAKPRHILLQILLILSSLFTVQKSSSALTSDAPNCSAETCYHLPIVFRQPPVAVGASGTYTGRGSAGGNYGFAGTVMNTNAGQPVYDVMVEAKIFNARGANLQTISQRAIFTATLENQPNSFSILTNTPASIVARHEVRILNYSLVSSRTFVSPTVTFQFTNAYGDITGTVKNTSPYTITDVIITFQEPKHTCELVGVAHVPGVLKPQQIANFVPSFCLYSMPWMLRYYQVAAQGVVVP